MSGDEEAIGFVREHRWAKAKEQIDALKKDGCAHIFDADKTKRSDVERLASAGRVLKVLFAFLLAQPRIKGGMLADFKAVLARIDKRGGIIKDVSTGLMSGDKLRHNALVAVVKDQLKRNAQGFRNSEINARRKGRPQVEFDPKVWADIEKIWLNSRDYPNEADALKAIWKLDKKFRSARGYKYIGPRKTKRKT